MWAKYKDIRAGASIPTILDEFAPIANRNNALTNKLAAEYAESVYNDDGATTLAELSASLAQSVRAYARLFGANLDERITAYATAQIGNMYDEVEGRNVSTSATSNASGTTEETFNAVNTGTGKTSGKSASTSGGTSTGSTIETKTTTRHDGQNAFDALKKAADAVPPLADFVDGFGVLFVDKYELAALTAWGV